MLNLINLYKDLLYHYKNDPKPPIARNAVLNSIPLTLYYTNIDLYQKLYTEFYVFYALFAQNTRDLISERVLLKIYKKLESLNFQYPVIIYQEFFYKHKKEYQKALEQILELLQSKHKRTLFMHDFLCIKRVGCKTTALIFNEFLEYNSWPIVDINVYRAYKCLEEKYDITKVKSPDQLFVLLIKLNNFCDHNLGFELARLLHSYRKVKNITKERSHDCKICLDI